MQEKARYFHADYRDGRVHIGGKVYQAGVFATHLLNQYYKDDTAARIAVFTTDNHFIRKKLSTGYIKVSEFVSAGERTLNLFNALPWLQPFTMLDTNAERNRVAELFSRENGEQIKEYFHRKAAVHSMDDDHILFNSLPKEYDEQFFKDSAALLDDVFSTLNFYDNLSNDMRNAFHGLQKFVSRTDEADRFDEEHLLPIALDIFGKSTFAVETEYVAIKKSNRSKTATIARRLYFENYYSFIITDFFEGLHHGHYPRQCEVCKKYFLMTSARKQKYCNGIAPELYNGEKQTCRQYAVMMGKKERIDDHPILSIHKKRCNCIRAELSKGTITREFADATKEMADKLKAKAIHGEEYTVAQFQKDMQRQNLYALVDEQLK